MTLVVEIALQGQRWRWALAHRETHPRRHGHRWRVAASCQSRLIPNTNAVSVMGARPYLCNREEVNPVRGPEPVELTCGSSHVFSCSQIPKFPQPEPVCRKLLGILFSPTLGIRLELQVQRTVDLRPNSCSCQSPVALIGPWRLGRGCFASYLTIAR